MTEYSGSTSRLFEALVFDLDGVIVDTERLIHAVWTDLFAEHGCSFTAAEWATAIGTAGGFSPYEALVMRSNVVPPTSEEIDRRVETLVGAQLRESGPLRGVRAWVEEAECRGLAVAIASSSPAEWVEARLTDVGLLAHFEVRATRSAVLPAKPEPDLYLEACRRLSVAPARALAVEDSLHGLTAAVAAGLTCVAVPGPLTAHLDFSSAAFVVDSLESFPLGQVLANLDLRGEATRS